VFVLFDRVCQFITREAVLLSYIIDSRFDTAISNFLQEVTPLNLPTHPTLPLYVLPGTELL
jgi:hypothetical protein